LQYHETIPAKAIFIAQFDIGFLLYGQLNTKTLALGNIPRLTFEGLVAAGAVFCFVPAHANAYYQNE